MRIAIPVVLTALLLGGCATAANTQQEVFETARNIGFMEPDARCIAQRTGRALTLGQWRALSRAARLVGRPARDAAVGEVADAISTHVDAQTGSVFRRLASDCAILRNRQAPAPEATPAG